MSGAAAAISPILAIALADFRERVRRYGFLLTLAFAAFLGFQAIDGTLVVALDDWRGVFNSAWAGGVMTLVATSFLSLAGFYVIKNAVERDRETGVGEILAATPLGKPAYLLGKWLSNVAVLAAMLAILALAAGAMVLVRGESRQLEIGKILLPFALVALPSMALVGALALAFEILPGLRRTFGNVFYFFFWGMLLAAGTQNRAIDVMGLGRIADSMMAAVRAIDPAYKNGLLIGAGRGEAGLKTFVWEGKDWTAADLAHAGLTFGLALGLTLVVAPAFRRFDPAAGGGQRRRRAGTEIAAAAAPSLVGARAVRLAALAPGRKRAGFARLAAAELGLALRSQRRIWRWFALGLLAAQALAPRPALRGGLLAAAAIWALPLLSAAGHRDLAAGVRPLLLAAPRPFDRQPLAALAAGVAGFALLLAPAAIRLALAGEVAGLPRLAAGILAVPAAALALGAWSGSAKLFEALFVATWYLGPLEKLPAADFLGAHATDAAGTWGWWAVGALAVPLALLARRRAVT